MSSPISTSDLNGGPRPSHFKKRQAMLGAVAIAAVSFSLWAALHEQSASTSADPRTIVSLVPVADPSSQFAGGVAPSFTLANVVAESRHGAGGQDTVSYSGRFGSVLGEKAAGTQVMPTTVHGGPVVIDFMASWCVPCRQELPDLAKVAKSVSPGVAFVGVDVNDTAGDMDSLLRASGAGFPVGFDPKGEVAARYHLVGLPTLFYVSASGRVSGEIEGQINRAGLLQWLSTFSLGSPARP